MLVKQDFWVAISHFLHRNYAAGSGRAGARFICTAGRAMLLQGSVHVKKTWMTPTIAAAPLAESQAGSAQSLSPLLEHCRCFGVAEHFGIAMQASHPACTILPGTAISRGCCTTGSHLVRALAKQTSDAVFWAGKACGWRFMTTTTFWHCQYVCNSIAVAVGSIPWQLATP